MQLVNDRFYDILVKYAAGEATEAQQQQIQQRLVAGEADNKMFADITMLLNECGQLALSPAVDEQAAWQKLLPQLEAKPAAPVIPLRFWLRIAVMLVLLAGVATLYFARDRKQAITVPAVVRVHLKSGANPIVDSLPDGSVIRLGVYSSLDYPAHFIDAVRSVRMEGEVFFTVVHNNARPFTVHVKDIVVTDIGTSFTIRSIAAQTNIIVKSGQVQVSKKASSVRLSAGESVSIQANDSIIVKTPDHVVSIKTPEQLFPAGYFKHIEEDTGKQKQLMRDIVSTILKEHLVVHNDSLVWFALNSNGFTINGIQQLPKVYRSFKDKYLCAGDNGFYYGPAKVTGKGFFYTKKELQ